MRAIAFSLVAVAAIIAAAATTITGHSSVAEGAAYMAIIVWSLLGISAS
jgi:hypothetical protein